MQHIGWKWAGIFNAARWLAGWLVLSKLVGWLVLSKLVGWLVGWLVGTQ